jgi:hypothetical protein
VCSIGVSALPNEGDEEDEDELSSGTASNTAIKKLSSRIIKYFTGILVVGISVEGGRCNF